MKAVIQPFGARPGGPPIQVHGMVDDTSAVTIDEAVS
jgi:hypothetical protein